MKTYSELREQIQELNKEAERLRKEEIASAIKMIRRAISDFGLTASDIGLDVKPGKKSTGGEKSTGRRVRTKQISDLPRKARKKVEPKYKDEAGNTWTGRGKKPKWLVASLSSGRTLESFLINQI